MPDDDRGKRLWSMTNTEIQMTHAEVRMTHECRSPDTQAPARAADHRLVIHHSGLAIDGSFGFRNGSLIRPPALP